MPVDKTHTLNYRFLATATNSRSVRHQPLTGLATLSHYIDKLFVVNDNDSSNRLYEFTTQDYINSHFRNKGIFTNSRTVHHVGVGGFNFDENKWSPSVNFLDKNGDPFHTRQATFAQSSWLTPGPKTQKGIAYIRTGEKKIEEPFNFSQKTLSILRTSKN